MRPWMPPRALIRIPAPSQYAAFPMQVLHPEYGAAAAAIAAASSSGAAEAAGVAQELRLFKDEAELMLHLDHP